jgi:hypothetical protein
MMMEGLATVGDDDFPQTATNISGCGWTNDRGDWSIDMVDDDELPDNPQPPLCAARDVLNKYNAVVVRTVNLGKRKQADVQGLRKTPPTKCSTTVSTRQPVPGSCPRDGNRGNKSKGFPVSEAFWTTSELAARRRVSRNSVHRVCCRAWLWMIC